jgi:two-component system sensor histidine kinase YesM
MTQQQLQSLTQKLEMNTVETVSTSIGMLNVNQRIKLFYGKQYGLHIESQLDKGTTVTIRVPLIRLQEATEND